MRVKVLSYLTNDTSSEDVPLLNIGRSSGEALRDRTSLSFGELLRLLEPYDELDSEELLSDRFLRFLDI